MLEFVRINVLLITSPHQIKGNKAKGTCLLMHVQDNVQQLIKDIKEMNWIPMILLLFPLKLNLLEAHANYFGLLKDEVAEFSSFRLVKLILVHWNGIELRGRMLSSTHNRFSILLIVQGNQLPTKAKKLSLDTYRMCSTIKTYYSRIFLLFFFPLQALVLILYVRDIKFIHSLGKCKKRKKKVADLNYFN